LGALELIVPTVVDAIMFSSTNPSSRDVIQIILLSLAKVEQMKQCKAHKKVAAAYEERKFIKNATTKALAKKKFICKGDGSEMASKKNTLPKATTIDEWFFYYYFSNSLLLHASTC
jgi:hypothetical protein